MQAEVVVSRGGQVLARHVLEGGQRLLVGAGPEAGCRLDDPLVSARHVVLELGPAGLLATDLDSETGTTCGGQQLPPRTAFPVAPGATLRPDCPPAAGEARRPAAREGPRRPAARGAPDRGRARESGRQLRRPTAVARDEARGHSAPWLTPRALHSSSS